MGAAGMAKGWYNKQGKKVLGKMLKKAGDWAKSKGIPGGLVDKAQAMAAKGADRAVAAGAKRLGAEELPLVVGRNRDDGWEETREEWGAASSLAGGLANVAGGALMSGVNALAGPIKKQVEDMSKTLVAGVKAVNDAKTCAANPYACAKKHCPAVALAVAKALTNALKGQVIAQATALCGSIAGQFGVLFAPIPPPGVIAGVATTAVGTYCVKEATALINKAFNMATQMAADTLCGAIFGKKELELLVQKMAVESERQSALYQISHMDETREEWGAASSLAGGLANVAGGALMSGVNALAGPIKKQVEDMSKTLVAGVKAVNDAKTCAANPYACAKKHCPAVALAVAKALTNALKGQVIARATALCGSIAGQF